AQRVGLAMTLGDHARRPCPSVPPRHPVYHRAGRSQLPRMRADHVSRSRWSNTSVEHVGRTRRSNTPMAVAGTPVWPCLRTRSKLVATHTERSPPPSEEDPAMATD